ncbi:hypothetical protein L3Q82_004462 [Scortum barcoo]|uniref:Uncharacterized protein n=1 Tax=Scortum barcoo TaxID=214431 RepID=A0ACB8VKG7_9TELE|nr:hypothetical protein L3Q82_004462 [Scortum barcoo]
MGTQGTGRKRSTKKERSTAEDDALNLIAREAEARLAAKRAARAEAREIRMKELERQQKELSNVKTESWRVRGHVAQLSVPCLEARTTLVSRLDKAFWFWCKRNGYDDDYSVMSGRASYASSDLYSFNGLSSSRNPGSAFKDYQSSLYEDSLCSGSRRVIGSTSHPLEYTSYRSSSSRASSRASLARASPVDNCGSVASFLRSAASSSGLPRDLDDVTIPDFSDVEDRDYLEKGSRAASALTAGTLTSLGGTSSRRGSGETAITVDAETSIREIKDALVEVEEKYRKAMVSNAQLDNEKNNLMYQVDVLKDSLMELEELLSESRREYEEKVKEYEREKHAHSVLQFQFNEMKDTLKQSEELLNALERQKEYTDAIRIERDELREEVVNLKDILKKHGIILGPDLNINGDSGEAEVDGSPSADPSSQPTPVSQTSPTEGNSMLGNTVATQLRSSGEEELDPEQCQAFEEAKENHLSSNMLSNVADVSTLETSSKEKPTEEQQRCLSTEEDTVKDNGLSKDSNVDDHLITEAKDVIICSTEAQGIVTSSEEHVPETETHEGGDLVKTSNPNLGETETKSSSVDAYSDNIRESCSIFEEQENQQKDVEERCLRNTEACPQQNVEQNVIKSFPDESVVAVSNTEPQQEPENAKEAENDEAEEIPSKSQPQGATASGKKKKKKKKGKKKGGIHDNKNQQKDGTDKEKGKTGKDIKSAAQGIMSTTEPEVDDSVTETLKESRVDQVKNEQDMRETKEIDGVETFSHNETLKELRMDNVADEHNKKQTLEMEKVEQVQTMAKTETISHVDTPKEVKLDHVLDEQTEEQRLENETEAAGAMRPTENFSHIETLEDSSTDPKKDEQDKEQTLENEEVRFPTGPVSETGISPSDLIERAESTDGLDIVCAPSVGNSQSGTDISTNGNFVHTESEMVDGVEDEVWSIDERKSENKTNNSEDTSETVGKENAEAESHVSGHGDAAADESDAIDYSESKDNTSVSLCSTDGVKNVSGSEPPPGLSADVNSACDDTPIEVSDRGLEEAAETVKDDEKPEQESFSVNVISPCLDGDNSELEPYRTEKEELDGDLREPESLVEPDSPSHDKRSNTPDSASLTNNSEKSLLETVVQDEQLADVESQTLQCEDQIDESNAEDSFETEEIDTINSPKEADETESFAEPHQSIEELAVAEDPEHKTSQNDEQSETNLCPLAEQLHEPNTDKSEDNDTSQPTLQDSDEDGEDEEGQSFDFDDMDVEAAIETNLPKDLIQEEVQQEVEVMSDESNNGSSGQYQNNTESNENTQDEPVESNDDKCSVDGGNQVDSSDEESDTKPQDNKNYLAHEEAASKDSENTENEVCEQQKNIPVEEEGVTDEPEPRPITEEGKVLNVGELVVAEENINQAVSLPVEEGLDASKYELQGEALVSPKSADEVATNKEPPQTGKDVKKNSKKGKGKGKED